MGLATGLAVAGIGASLLGSRSQSRAAERAAEAQTGAQREAIAEQRRQFNRILELNEPLHESNLRALRAQEDLLGLGGLGSGGQISSPAGSQTAIPAQPGQQVLPPLSRGGDSPAFGRQSPLDRTRRDRFIENQIRNLTEGPDAQRNRQLFLQQQVQQGNISPDNPFIQNILRGFGG